MQTSEERRIAYYVLHRAGIYNSPHPENSPGQWIGHCGVWQQIVLLPHRCIRCGVAVLGQKED